ncbi:MAG: 3-ketoacyl-ACP reductase [Gammaproteobacteria bacterium]|jgi:NAD(P)-dependent dehydrogenase (short-subunit alcohol dehydrogenase family)|nr:3-ketoacyl-ACP reductase [Gammaproteobacteria bacterium]HJL51475.1 3-ketoacyl-ACP reductase [Arenicellales bacterium]|tara:strand:+ start:4998 stop:5774 length:777 start_codon:yes stop_codon:yes gene_type:complete
MREKVAIVTGSSRGIGRGIVLALAEHAWSVVVNYRSNQAAAENTLQAAQFVGAKGIIVQGDVANKEDQVKLVEATLEHFERVDLLVNNAGIGPRVRVDMLEASEQSYDEVMATNLKGPFFLTQLVARKMVHLIEDGKVQSPKIVNIGSISAYTSSPARAEYCISKAGVGMMTALWADRLAEYGINVYEIRPGIIETDLTSVVKDKYDHLIQEEGITPIRRWGQPQDIGKAVVAIAEGLLPFSTGEVINVDGGFHLTRL